MKYGKHFQQMRASLRDDRLIDYIKWKKGMRRHSYIYSVFWPTLLRRQVKQFDRSYRVDPDDTVALANIQTTYKLWKRCRRHFGNGPGLDAFLTRDVRFAHVGRRTLIEDIFRA